MEGSSFIAPLPRFEPPHPLRAIQTALIPLLADPPEVVELRNCLRRRDLMRVALRGLMLLYDNNVIDGDEGMEHEDPEKGKLIMEGCQAILNKLQDDDGTPIRLRPRVLRAAHDSFFRFLEGRPEEYGAEYAALEDRVWIECLWTMSCQAYRGQAGGGIFASTGPEADDSHDANDSDDTGDSIDTEPRPAMAAADAAAPATRG